MTRTERHGEERRMVFEPTEPFGPPARIQRKRTRGFDLQAASLALNGRPAVVVTRPTKWGNPHRVGDILGDRTSGDIQRAVRSFGIALRAGRLPVTVADVRRELRWKNLACFCGEGPCHADVLLAIANKGDV